MFLERLSKIAHRIDGTMALALVGADGIPVESVCSEDNLDIEMLSAELVTQARTVSENHRDLSVGTLRQFSITTEELTLILSSLTGEYFLLLVLGQAANYGRARFELRRARLLFEEDLA